MGWAGSRTSVVCFIEIGGTPSGRYDTARCALPANVLLVGQTSRPLALLFDEVPTRPSQNNPERVADWERRRKAVGARIRELRTAHGMTQEALALQSGVTRNVLIDVEHGRRGLLYERLFDLADALDVTAADLLT